MLHEALTARADPLHLSMVFASPTTACKYTLIACDLLADQSIEAAKEQHYVPGEPSEIPELSGERYGSLLKHGTMLVNRYDPPGSRGCWPYRGDLLQFCGHHDSEAGELTAASGRRRDRALPGPAPATMTRRLDRTGGD